MRVVRAEAMGMCFGVRDALAALGAVADPASVTIRGELVHNEAVLDGLRGRGFGMLAESVRDELPATPVVAVTAHGISDRERSRLESGGKRVLDTTCPLVRRAHLAARGLAERGYHVLVAGRPGHVEVRGIVEDLPSYDVVPDCDTVREYASRRLGVIAQTTTAPRKFQAICAAVRERNPAAEIRVIDTVCRPTEDRQLAVERLLEQVEAMVVVGGRNSNNTRELVELCRERGRPAWHVQGAGDLVAGWFEGVRVVGLTAGTSTLDATVDEVERALESLGVGGAA
jgi:4-hydroxy-3-methylbut-2-enyl diphosphate reductase